MDSSISAHYWPSNTSISSFILLLFAFIFLYYSKSSKGKGVAPPRAPGALPLIGHLHKLGGVNDLPHRVLGSMADKYGPAFTIKFGVHPTLVVSNLEMVKECFTKTNDRLFSNRPSPLVNKHIFYSDDSFGFGPYGPFWREMRKISAVHLLSNHRIGRLKSSIVSEMNASFKDLYHLCDYRVMGNHGECPVSMEMKSWFEDVMFNVVATVVVGRRNLEGDEGNKYKKAMDEARGHMSTFAVTDVIPFLWWIDYLRGVDSSMKQTAKKIDTILVTWLEEHRRGRNQNKLSNHTKAEVGEDEDFMDVMLSIAEEGINVVGHDLDTVIKSICLDMILGGSDTTTATLTWTLSLLLNNRHVLEKARDELDLTIGNERQVEELDLKNLIYLQAIFKEAMRLYPAGALNERYTTEDCSVGDFHVGAGTRLLINIWKIQRDPNVWLDPSEFRPERFLTKEYCHIDVRGHDFELIPFGTGRRMCPGVSFALQLMSLALGRLIHGFDLMTLAEEPTIDMSETPGVFNYKATPLHVLLTPRFQSKFYGC